MKHFILLLFTLLLFSCNKKENKISANENEKKSIVKDSIVGIYYVSDFRDYLSKGFTLKKEKPEKQFFVYKLEFTNNGNIKFSDLDEEYDCGNGLMRIKKSGWLKKSSNRYILSFVGDYYSESSFSTQAEFEVMSLPNGNKKMKLVKVLKKVKKPFTE